MANYQIIIPRERRSFDEWKNIELGK